MKLPLILPSLSTKFKTLNNSINPNNMYNLNPKTSDKSKISIKQNNIRKTLFPDKEFVKNLDIDLNPSLIMAHEAELKKLKENIDNNPDIELKRLNKYKTKQTTDEKDIESKEKVKILEKKYNDDLNEYKTIKLEKEKFGEHILNIINIIEDYKLEIYTFNNYFEDLFKKFCAENKERKEEIKNKIENLSYKDIDEYNLLDKELRNLDYNNRYYFQEQLQKKKQNINENIIKAQELLQKLQEKKNIMNETIKELKSKIKENKINLIKLYHLSLYEGLDFRYEGLSYLIRSIWNLGVDVDLKYMPRYLDKILVNYLFDHAKIIIEINKWRKQLDISREKFMKELQEWKSLNYNTFINEENSQRSSNNNSDVDLFKTKLDKNINKPYPKSLKFMKNYYNKYYYLIDNKEKNELNDYRKSRLENVVSIPKKFIDEYKIIEKGKIILQNLQNKMKKMEKDEIIRICREFSFNNYGNVYKVCPYIIVGAICGNEYREEGMMLFNMTEREIADNKKVIRFFEPCKYKINL